MNRGRSVGRGVALGVVVCLAGSVVAAQAVADDRGDAAQVEWGTCPKDVVAEPTSTSDAMASPRRPAADEPLAHA